MRRKIELDFSERILHIIAVIPFENLPHSLLCRLVIHQTGLCDRIAMIYVGFCQFFDDACFSSYSVTKLTNGKGEEAMKQSGIYFIASLLVLTLSESSIAQELYMPLVRTLIGHRSNVNCVVYSPDGKILASGGYNNTIKLWDMQTGNVMQSLTWRTRFISDVTSLSFSPNGKRLASGSTDNGNSIKIWSQQTGTWRELRTLTDYNHVYCLAFNKDGRILAVASPPWPLSYKNNTILWHVTTGVVQEIIHNRENTGTIKSVAFSPNGRILACGSEAAHRGDNDTVRLWDATSLQELKTLIGLSAGKSVVFSPDGKTIAGSSDDFFKPEIKLWDVASGRELLTLTANTSALAFSPDGKTLASGGAIPNVRDSFNTIKFWDVATGRELQTLNGHSEEILSVAFSPDGRTLASGSSDDTIKLWDVSLCDPDLAKLYLPIATEKDAALEAITQLFKSKDEFETDAEYQTRIAKATAQKKAIEDKHALRFAELKKEFFQKKELENQRKISDSRSEVTLTIENVGTYNADAETFPITIEGATKDVKIPRAEARSFKEKWQNAVAKGFKQLNKHLVTYEYVDLVIIHPETASRFAFVDPWVD